MNAQNILSHIEFHLEELGKKLTAYTKVVDSVINEMEILVSLQAAVHAEEWELVAAIMQRLDAFNKDRAAELTNLQ